MWGKWLKLLLTLFARRQRVGNQKCRGKNGTSTRNSEKIAGWISGTSYCGWGKPMKKKKERVSFTCGELALTLYSPNYLSEWAAAVQSRHRKVKEIWTGNQRKESVDWEAPPWRWVTKSNSFIWLLFSKCDSPRSHITIAIILNEHLVEAMKRIKEGVSDTSVDR